MPEVKESDWKLFSKENARLAGKLYGASESELLHSYITKVRIAEPALPG